MFGQQGLRMSAPLGRIFAHAILAADGHSMMLSIRPRNRFFDFSNGKAKEIAWLWSLLMSCWQKRCQQNPRMKKCRSMASTHVTTHATNMQQKRTPAHFCMNLAAAKANEFGQFLLKPRLLGN